MKNKTTNITLGIFFILIVLTPNLISAAGMELGAGMGIGITVTPSDGNIDDKTGQDVAPVEEEKSENKKDEKITGQIKTISETQNKVEPINTNNQPIILNSIEEENSPPKTNSTKIMLILLIFLILGLLTLLIFSNFEKLKIIVDKSPFIQNK